MKRYRLTVTVRAPVLTAETSMGAYGVDTPVARDFDGTPYVPGSHMRGKLRDALVKLTQAGAAVADPDDLFGAGDGERARVYIGDLRAETPEDDRLGTIVRVAVDDATGAVEEGALLVAECPWKPGQPVTFSGTLLVDGDDSFAASAEPALRAALGWVAQLGGERTVGYGRVLDADPPEEEALPHPAAADFGDPPPRRLRVVLHFLEPFCISEPRLAHNVHEGRTIVPGGVLKGALAQAARRHGISEDQSFWEHLAKVRFGHLHPVKMEDDSGRAPGPLPEDALRRAGRVPLHPPLSLAWTGKELVDLALADDATLVDGRAPAFRPDFKGEAWEKLEALFGSFHVPRQLRVRTAMCRDLRAASPEQLYAYRVVGPGGYLWVGELELSALDDAPRKEWLEGLCELLKLTGGIIAPIGKTDAPAQLFLLPAADPAEPVAASVGGERYHVVVLQSQALLLDPKDVGIAGTPSDHDPAEHLKKAYRQTFLQLGDGLELVRHFARQRLEGGAWHLARFMGNGTYREWVTTEPGSTFVFRETNPAKAKDTLRRWRDRGLGLAPRVRQAYGLDTSRPDHALWELCPYVPQNGYGSVAVDLPVHVCYGIERVGS